MFGASPLDDASSRLLGLLNSRLSAPGSSAVVGGGVGGASHPDLLEHQHFRCIVCLASFPSGWLLKRHAILQHSLLPTSLAANDEKPFVCEQCGQSYRYRSAYLKHREQNHRARLPADKLFTCDVCGMQFRYLKSFKKHRLNHALERLHGKTLTPELEFAVGDGGGRSAPSSTDRFMDKSESESNEVTSTINESTSHDDDVAKNSVDLDVDGDADTDGRPEKDADDTFVHVKQEVPEVGTSSAAPGPTIADRKHGEYSDQDNTIDSLSFPGSSGGLPIDAFQLAQEASILNLLQADAVERHQRERRFACPFCGKCVRSKENLKLHVRKHTGERPFVCLFCGRAFGGKSDLTRHLRIHTGERPYHCEACGKCFARADYLSKHLTTHMHTPR